MPISNSWSAPEKKSFPPLPEDTYQVFIEDVELVTGKAYKSDEEVEQLKFTFQILDGEFKGRKLWKQVSPVMSAGGAGKNPANFNLIYEAVYKVTPYHNQVKTISPELINDFIGCQLILVVKTRTNEQGVEGNKIGGYMKAKADIALPEGYKKPVQASVSAEIDDEIPVIEDGEPIDLKDIPF